MQINHDIAVFMTSPVMIVLGTSDDASQPAIGRAIGVLVQKDEGCIDVMVSEWQWPAAVANVRANGRLAATFARPSDYVSFQVKGRAAVLPATAEHLSSAVRYVERITATLEGLGLDSRIVTPWFVNRDLLAVRLSVDEIFVQTPGARAGQLVERQ